MGCGSNSANILGDESRPAAAKIGKLEATVHSILCHLTPTLQKHSLDLIKQLKAMLYESEVSSTCVSEEA